MVLANRHRILSMVWYLQRNTRTGRDSTLVVSNVVYQERRWKLDGLLIPPVATTHRVTDDSTESLRLMALSFTTYARCYHITGGITETLRMYQTTYMCWT